MRDGAEGGGDEERGGGKVAVWESPRNWMEMGGKRVCAGVREPNFTILGFFARRRSGLGCVFVVQDLKLNRPRPGPGPLDMGGEGGLSRELTGFVVSWPAFYIVM